MFKMFINAFKVKDIRKRLLFTFICLIVVRIGSQLPVPGINSAVFASWMDNMQGLGFLDTLTGGSFTEMSIFALNIGPYITSSIIMQLLTIAIPKIEEMQKEGEEGKKKIASISRYLTVVLALIEAIAMAISFGNQGILKSGTVTFSEVAIIAVSFTAGSAFLMWLGEKITDRGVGNGISIILLINIVARLPQDLSALNTKYITGADSVVNGIIGTIVIVLVIVVLVGLIILLQDGERKIAVQYAKRVQGRKMVGGNSSSIPIKVNTAGVIPVIFAMSIMQFPIIISSFFSVTGNPVGSVWERILYGLNQQNWFNTTTWADFSYSIGLIFYLAMIFFFAYFYTAITFNPLEIANNMKRNGGFIPGIRPGKPTSDYMSSVLNKVIFIGATGLVIVSIIPIALTGIFNVPVHFAATSIIIVVGVILETMKQIESQMLVRHYKGFLND